MTIYSIDVWPNTVKVMYLLAVYYCAKNNHKYIFFKKRTIKLLPKLLAFVFKQQAYMRFGKDKVIEKSLGLRKQIS